MVTKTTRGFERYTARMSNRHRPSPQSPPVQAALPATISIDWRDHILTALTLAVLVLAFVRCLVPLTPNLYWENDPRQMTQLHSAAQSDLLSEDAGEIPVQFFGPAGAVMLDTLSITIAGLALLVHVRFGGALRLGSIALGLVGIAFCCVHLQSNIENTFTCGAWIGAVSLALAILHLACRERQRRWVLASLAALAVPLLFEAARYVFLDHAETVAMFKQGEEAYLAARGWTRGSPEHLMYLRRMEFGEPTGAFTFSNILGSISAALAMLGSLIAYGLWRSRQHLQHRWLLPGIVAILAAWTMVLTHSKGAPVAFVMTCCLIALILISVRKQRGLILIPAVPIVLLLVALAVVLVRGFMGAPSTADGERSLLFRFHYWQAAARITTQSVSCATIGVGPAQFADDYNWAKNPINPEEVRSAHSVFIDHIAMLGLGGLALSALLVLWLARAAVNGAQRCSLNSDRPEPAQRTDPQASALAAHFDVPRGDLLLTIAFVAVLFGIDFAIRGASYGTPGRFLLWSTGMTFTFFVTAVLASRSWLPRSTSALALMGAAAVLLIHGQIEMTYFQASSAPIAWLIIAAAAADQETRGTITSRSPLAFVPGGLLLLIAGAVAFTITMPLMKQQSLLAQAERLLRTNPASWPAFNQTIELLREAETVGPHNVKPYEWQSRLAMEAASHMNAGLRNVPPAQIRPEARQEIQRYALLSLEALERAPKHGLNSMSLRRQQAQMLLYAGEILGDPNRAEQAVSAWNALIVERPYAWQDRVELADLYWRLDRKDLARQHYAKAIELSDNMYLEPTRQMPALERKRIDERLSAIAIRASASPRLAARSLP